MREPANPVRPRAGVGRAHQRMIPKSMSSTPIEDGYRFPACAKPWHRPIMNIDASAGGDRSEKIMRHQ
jgi:hypothetical protein